MLSPEVVCSEAEGGGAVGDAVVGTAPDERYVTGGDPDRRLRVVQPQPGMTPDDGVDGELDGAGQPQPPRGSCDGTSEDRAGCSCAGEVFLEHVHLMRVSRSN